MNTSSFLEYQKVLVDVDVQWQGKLHRNALQVYEFRELYEC